MQIRLQKFYQLLLTALGLALLIIAVALNHYHPHNQGVADITKTSIYKRLGISSASSANYASLSYLKALPPATSKDTDKMPDPTISSGTGSPALPQAPLAGEDPSSVNNVSPPADQNTPNLNAQAGNDKS